MRILAPIADSESQAAVIRAAPIPTQLRGREVRETPAALPAPRLADRAVQGQVQTLAQGPECRAMRVPPDEAARIREDRAEQGQPDKVGSVPVDKGARDRVESTPEPIVVRTFPRPSVRRIQRAK